MGVSYEVTVVLEPPLAGAFQAYMREKHIPEILATGCFTGARFEQVSSTRFRTAYLGSQAGLDRYLAEHAAAFREDFLRHFPAGATASREVWSAVHVWPG